MIGNSLPINVPGELILLQVCEDRVIYNRRLRSVACFGLAFRFYVRFSQLWSVRVSG